MAGENLYEILGVSANSSPGEIRHAYYQKAKELHPDALRSKDIPEEDKRRAEERLKVVNKAYAVLSDPVQRKDYDAIRIREASPPIPELSPSVIRITGVKPGEIQKTHFVIANIGGACNKIDVDNPESWVRITGFTSLSQEEKLPLQVDLELWGENWGTTHRENIEVSLDDVHTHIQVELITANEESKPADYNTRLGTPYAFSNLGTTFPSSFPYSTSHSPFGDTFLKEMIGIVATPVYAASAALIVTPLCLVSEISLTGWLSYAPSFSALAALMTAVCIMPLQAIAAEFFSGYTTKHSPLGIPPPLGKCFTQRKALTIASLVMVCGVIIHLSYML